MALQEQVAHERLLLPVAASVEVRMLASDAMLVRLSGEHDASTAKRLADAFVAVRDQANVIVDLTDCSSIDSTGVAVICAPGSLISGQTRLVVGRPAEWNSGLLPTYETVEAALDSFQ
jgi:anti-anti-sigma factor